MEEFFIRGTRCVIRRLLKLSRNRIFLDPFSWKIIRCRFDGIDFIHTWNRGALVWFEPTPLAISITLEDLPLFLNYSNISPGDTILIAGAGMGSEIGHFSNLVGTDGIVIAIEPDGDAFRRLSKVVSLLPVKNVNLLNCAVGKESGETLLYMPDFHTVSNTTINIGPTRMQSKKVFMQTIEMICNNLKVDQIDYLKMNIEGAEYSALMGVGKIKVNHFCISCHDFLGKQFRTREKVTSKLIREGYELFGTSEVPGKPWVGSYIYAKNQQPNT